MASLSAVAALLVTGCQQESAPVAEPDVRAVKVFEVQDVGAVKVVEFPGQISAVQKSWKAFEVPGRVIERLVKEGEMVKKGQVLARLDPRDYQYAFDSAKAQLEAAELVAKRIGELTMKKAVSQQELDLAQRDLRKATAQWQQAKKALEDTELIADFDGRVAQLMIDDFSNVAAKEDVMLIQNNAQLEIVVNVPESAVALPVKGETSEQKVTETNPEVILSVFPGKVFPATYREASERPDPATRTYAVKLTFTPGEDDWVRPGMTAKVRAYVPAGTTPGLSGFPVPVESIVSEGGQNAHVWKLDPTTQTVAKVEIAAGDPVGNSVVVDGALESGDLVVISGAHLLQDGQSVKIWTGAN